MIYESECNQKNRDEKRGAFLGANLWNHDLPLGKSSITWEFLQQKSPISGTFLFLVRYFKLVAGVRQDWKQIISDVKKLRAIAEGDNEAFDELDDTASFPM
jgi:hypothetical protein